MELKATFVLPEFCTCQGENEQIGCFCYNSAKGDSARGFVSCHAGWTLGLLKVASG